MRILAIETATLVCGAAIAENGIVKAEEWIEERNIHAERLMALVEEVFRKCAVTAREIDAVAVSIGPGSFTGLRIGASVAKGIAYAAGKPVIPVPTLTALAHRLAREGGESLPPFLLAVLDARRDEVYCQLFSREGRKIGSLAGPEDMTVAAAAALCEGKEIMVTGEAAAKVISLAPGLRTAPEDLLRSSAAEVALVADELFREGRSSDPGSIEPLYIKEFFVRHRPQA